jgi:hypothetical protein
MAKARFAVKEKQSKAPGKFATYAIAAIIIILVLVFLAVLQQQAKDYLNAPTGKAIDIVDLGPSQCTNGTLINSHDEDQTGTEYCMCLIPPEPELSPTVEPSEEVTPPGPTLENPIDCAITYKDAQELYGAGTISLNSDSCTCELAVETEPPGTPAGHCVKVNAKIKWTDFGVTPDSSRFSKWKPIYCNDETSWKSSASPSRAISCTDDSACNSLTSTDGSTTGCCVFSS